MSRRRVSLAIGMLLAVGVAPAFAASVTALDFVAGASPANAFLVESSRLAAAQAGSRRILAFARREAGDREPIVGAFADWATAERRAAREADLGPSLDMLGRIFGPTDRSVAVVVREGRPVLPDLARLRGRDFDTLYVASQRDTLERLVAFYVDFIKNGDDVTLRALAVRDLPRARQWLAEVRRL